MADSYIGEIRIFCGKYIPADWMACDGTELSVQSYQALYAVIGNIYGGTAGVSFKLPNLSGLVPIGTGQGAGLTNRVLASETGESQVTLSYSAMANHGHPAAGLAARGNSSTPALCVPAEIVLGVRNPMPITLYHNTADVSFNDAAMSAVGGGQPHNNMQPYLPLIFMISLAGEFPIPAD